VPFIVVSGVPALETPVPTRSLSENVVFLVKLVATLSRRPYAVYSIVGRALAPVATIAATATGGPAGEAVFQFNCVHAPASWTDTPNVYRRLLNGVRPVPPAAQPFEVAALEPRCKRSNICSERCRSSESRKKPPTVGVLS
jgi:hypothetical protein